MKIIKMLIGALATILIVVFVLNTFLIPNDYRDCGFDQLIDCRDDVRTGSSTDCDISRYQAKCLPVDAIVVISGGDTRARTEHGVKLYQAGVAKTLILSGAAYQSGVPSNAEEMAQIAIDLGVLQNDILVETESRNTYQNAEFVKDALERFGYKSIALVTSAYHQRRAETEFRKFLGEKIDLYNAPVLKDKDWSTWWFLKPRAWYLAVKEVFGLFLASTGASR